MKHLMIALAVLPMGALGASSGNAQTYAQTVQASNPEAYFRLTTSNSGSTTGGYTTSYSGTVTTGPGAPIVSDPSNTGALFNGVNGSNTGIITTSLSGGVPGKGTILAWVNLATLPSTSGHIDYVAGESQSGNDFDLQFEPDNTLRFYTGSGENTVYRPVTGTLVGQWHFIAATYDATLGDNSFRDIYWDGALGTAYSGGVNSAAKASAFTIGYSPVFGDREFPGGIDEVAVYNHALTAAEISNIYAARLNPAGTVGAVPEPATWAMMIVGFGGIGFGLRRAKQGARLRCA